MNRGCIRWRVAALAAGACAASPAAAHDLSWIWQDQVTVLEKPWALGVKPASLAGAKSAGRLQAVKPAVINRAWPATVHLAKPKRPMTTGALTPVSYTPYSPPETSLQSIGLASFYWQEQMTSSGERFDKTAMTAAHKTLPMHTRVRVTRLDTGRSVIVRINDRGPFKTGRIIDLSDAAAEALSMRTMGLAQVKIEVIR
jgi:rare lipoprotein A